MSNCAMHMINYFYTFCKKKWCEMQTSNKYYNGSYMNECEALSNKISLEAKLHKIVRSHLKSDTKNGFVSLSKNNHITGGCIINTTNPIFISSKVWNSCSSLTSTRKLIQNIFTVLHISIFSGLTVFVMYIFANNFANIKHFKYFSVISSSILCASKLVLTIWTKWYSL